MEVWHGGAARADYAMVWAPPQQFFDEQTALKAIFNMGAGVDALLQRESGEGESQTDVIILTHNTVEGRMREAIAAMQALPTVLAPIVSLRKEELA